MPATGMRLKTTSSSSSVPPSKVQASEPSKKPLFKADDVIVAEALRNAQYQQLNRGTSTNFDAMADRSNNNDCQRCGKPLKPSPTINCKFRFY